MDPQHILDYWFPNDDYNEFWFDTTPDEHIKITFSCYYSHRELNTFFDTNDGKLALIILYDQMTRNIHRGTDRMYENDGKALAIAKDLVCLDKEFALNRRIFILMPFRHSLISDNLDFVMTKISEYESEFENNKILRIFKKATLQNYTRLTDRIILSDYNISNLCYNRFNDVIDNDCVDYTHSKSTNISSKKLFDTLKKFVIDRNIKNIGISLSGGVDSMVIAHGYKLLKSSEIIDDVYAIHLEYNNRVESLEETELIQSFCFNNNIPLYIRRIHHMTRELTEREFYESETKKIRFNTYKWLIEKHNISGFVLGHHKDDLSENVFMNIIQGKDILELLMMTEDSVIDGVHLFRPALTHHKSDIFEIAKVDQIPYLKNTTPSWSCRGVYREQLLPIITSQWGNNNLLMLGKQSEQWCNVVDKMILQPLYEKITRHKNGTKIIINDTNLPFVIWTKIFLKIFHGMEYHMITKKNLEFAISLIMKNNNPIKLSFSNGTIGIWNNGELFVFSNKFNTAKCIEHDVCISPCDRKKNNKISFDDILHGQIVYYENCSSIEDIKSVSKFCDLDYISKLYTKVSLMRDILPKYSSGVCVNTENSFIITISC